MVHSTHDLADPPARRLAPLAVAVATVALIATLVVAPAQAETAPTTADDPPPTGFDAIAANDELTSDHARLFRLYWAFFIREPDAGGALYWIAQRNACAPLAAIADVFAASHEFELRYGQLDDRAFVEQIYRNVLGRRGDTGGLTYWTELLTQQVLTRGGLVLNVSLSTEFQSRHPYPSDGVPARPCSSSTGAPVDRQLTLLGGTEVGGTVLATVAGIAIHPPAAAIELAGFHQSSHPGALSLAPGASPVRLTTMESRRRGTDRRGAVDVVTGPRTPIVAPVSGRVARAGDYVLYCRYRDGYVVINPDGRPDLEVKVLHVQGVAVGAGQRVTAGDRIAASATAFPFRSQVDDLTAEPSWPHVHLEVVDPSIPRKTSGGSC